MIKTSRLSYDQGDILLCVSAELKSPGISYELLKVSPTCKNSDFFVTTLNEKSKSYDYSIILCCCRYFTTAG